MRHCIPIAFLTAAICAQEHTDPLRWVPKDCFMVLRAAGPAALQAAFAEVQLARVFDGDALKPALTKLEGQFTAAVDAVRGKTKVDLDALGAIALAYSGELVLALQLDYGAEAAAEPEPSILIALGPDGHTDMAALAAMLGEAAEAEEKVTDLEVAGHTLRVAARKRVQFALPFVHDGSLVTIFAHDLETAVPRFLDAKEPIAASALSGGPIAMHMDLHKVVAKSIDQGAADLEEQGVPFEARELFTKLGADAPDDIDFAIRAEGKALVGDVHLGLTDSDRGLLGILMPPDASRPKLLGVVPADRDEYTILPFDVGAIYATTKALFELAGDSTPTSLGELEDKFAEACKVRLKEDLLDHVGRELMLLPSGDPAKAAIAAEEAEEDDPSPAKVFDGLCLCLHLRDGKAFGDAIEQLLRARGLHAARKSEEYRGTKIHEFRAFGFEYAVTDELLLIAVGKGIGETSLRHVLDAAADRAAGKGGAELAASVRDRLAKMPEGFAGISVSSPTAAMATAAGILEKAVQSGDGAWKSVEPFAEDADMIGVVVEALKGMRSQLKTLGLDTAVSAFYVEKSGLRFLQYW